LRSPLLTCSCLRLFCLALWRGQPPGPYGRPFRASAVSGVRRLFPMARGSSPTTRIFHPVAFWAATCSARALPRRWVWLHCRHLGPPCALPSDRSRATVSPSDASKRFTVLAVLHRSPNSRASNLTGSLRSPRRVVPGRSVSERDFRGRDRRDVDRVRPLNARTGLSPQ
jgi:hypothetical protein